MSFIYEPSAVIHATLGETFSTPDFIQSEYEFIPIYNASYDTFTTDTRWPFHKRTDGYLSGTTIDEDSVALGDVLITCLWNRNMAIVSKTRSHATLGTWTVYGLDPDDTYGYTIVAQDPTTGTVYNSVSYDKIIPATPV